MNIKSIININKDILGGQPVFTGTRVPIESLFDHLEEGVSLEEFIDEFPTVSREQAIALIEYRNANKSYFEAVLMGQNIIFNF